MYIEEEEVQVIYLSEISTYSHWKLWQTSPWLSCPLSHSSQFGRVGTSTILSLHNMQQSGANDNNPYQTNLYLKIVVSSIKFFDRYTTRTPLSIPRWYIINTPLESLDSSILGHACAECMHYTKPQQPSINNSFHFPISWYDGSIWGWHYQLHLH